MSTSSLLPEYAEPGPALVIAAINLAMAVNLAWLGLVLGGSAMRLLVGLRTHESVGETPAAGARPWCIKLQLMLKHVSQHGVTRAH